MQTATLVLPIAFVHTICSASIFRLLCTSKKKDLDGLMWPVTDIPND
jgi:hypothetical protein